MANLTPAPDGLTVEQGADVPGYHDHRLRQRRERADRDRLYGGRIRPGPDRVVDNVGAKLKGTTRIVAVDAMPERLEMSRQLGADLTINFREVDPVAKIMRLTDGRGVHVATEVLELQQASEACRRFLKPGWRVVWPWCTRASSRCRVMLSRLASADHRMATHGCAPVARNESAGWPICPRWDNRSKRN
jgi:hypothetical protein